MQVLLSITARTYQTLRRRPARLFLHTASPLHNSCDSACSVTRPRKSRRRVESHSLREVAKFSKCRDAERNAPRAMRAHLARAARPRARDGPWPSYSRGQHRRYAAATLLAAGPCPVPLRVRGNQPSLLMSDRFLSSIPDAGILNMKLIVALAFSAFPIGFGFGEAALCSVYCNGSPCGPEEFCNFNSEKEDPDGPSQCEACEQPSGKDPNGPYYTCDELGVPDAGKADCRACCADT